MAKFSNYRGHDDTSSYSVTNTIDNVNRKMGIEAYVKYLPTFYAHTDIARFKAKEIEVRERIVARNLEGL